MANRPQHANTSWKATCFVCDTEGVLGTELVYRGETRPRNLLCDKCFKEGKTWETLA